MWPTTGFRHVSLLPSQDPVSRPPKFTLARRPGNIFIVLVIFTVVVIVGVARTFDFQVIVSSRRPNFVSPEISSVGSMPVTSVGSEHPLDTFLLTHAPTYVPVGNENLSMDEIKAMVSQTRGFYARDYSLGLGWNNVCSISPFIFFCPDNAPRFAIS